MMARSTGSLGFVGLALLLAGCASQVVGPGQPDPVNNNLYATLYLRTAAEYDALGRTIFGAAGLHIDALLSDSNHSAAIEQRGQFSELPPGVIVDVDETVLDNSAYQATLVAENISYTTPHWDGWVAEAKADAVPGAVAFAISAASRGVTMLYLTNRRCIQRDADGDPCPQRAETIENLVRVGFPEPDPGNVYLRSAEFDFDSDKGSRRRAFAERYRIIMLFGDDLGDFVSGLKEAGVTPADRDAVVARHAERWGREWFVLPNPSYGSWLGVLGDELYDQLEPWQTGDTK
ncbi:MAG: acid phosphatase [Gammaproteobacteria bacterium]|nr:acid phosphatase [Gammaproteobacteria bacterium]